MSYIQAIILGLVQGLGEFLPISSSAHLIIVPWLFGWGDQGASFDVALHLGTTLAIISYFFKDWLQIFKGSALYTFKKDTSPENKSHRNILLYLIIATIPGAVIGLLLESVIETKFRQPLLIAFNMVLLGTLMGIADKRFSGKKTFSDLGLIDSLVMGFSQSVALVPGVSRSGVTMTTGLFLGMERTTVARFSFLMATPITLGACILKVPHLFSNGGLTGPLIVGIIVSAVTGFLSIKYLLAFIRKYSFRIFVYYRYAFALIILIVFLLRL